jgi:anti-anti-sigma factor
MGWLSFDMRQTTDADGALRLRVSGALDIAVADLLGERLRQLGVADRRVRLDLSEVGFIDCSGVETVLQALTAARRRGWRLEVDRRVGASVERMIDFMAVAHVLWPPEAGSRGATVRMLDAARRSRRGPMRSGRRRA